MASEDPSVPTLQPSGWVIDELANAGRENTDAEHVRHYDDKEDAQAPAEVNLLVERGLGPNSLVIDLGAGTGQFALEAAATGATVVAVDVSPVMLEQLRAKAPLPAFLTCGSSKPGS